MKGLIADCRHAVRLYLRTPGASLVAIAVVAVAMAFVGSFLSLYVDLAMRPHPGLDAGNRLVTIGQSDGEAFAGMPFAIIERMPQELSSLDAAVGVVATSLQGDNAREFRAVELVTDGFTRHLRPRLQLGRGFEPTDHDLEAEPVVIVSHRYWQDELGGRNDVIGRNIEIHLAPTVASIGPDGEMVDSEDDTTEFRVIGVMARRMTGLMTENVMLWLPYERAGRLVVRVPDAVDYMSQRAVQTIGLRAAAATAESVLADAVARYGEDHEELGVRAGYELDVMDGVVRNINVQRDSTRQLRLFLAASVLLAFVAAANVSLFLLARAPGRRRELAIRMSVGAPLKRLSRQLATESALLIVVAAVAGLALSVWLTSFLRGLAFLRQAEWQNVTLLDWRVLGLVGGFLLVLTSLVSIAPIMGLKRLGIAASSRKIVARATPAQRIAGTVQISIAGALAAAGIAFGWYLASMVLGYPGYETKDRYVTTLAPDLSITSFQEFQRIAESNASSVPRRREVIEAIPGVTRVAFGSPVPATGNVGNSEIPDPRDPDKRIRVGAGWIDSQYLDVLGVRLVAGTAPMDNSAGTVLVNRAFAREYWGREDVVGEFVETGAEDSLQVIGVIEDISFEHPAAVPEPLMFRTEFRSLTTTAVIETSLAPAALSQELDRLEEEGALEMRWFGVDSLSDMRGQLLAADRARGFLTIGTAALVVVLAGLGFYGTQRYLVTAGRREYAVRASLGAGPRALGRLVFLRGLSMGAPGLVLGTMLAFIAAAWLRGDYVSSGISAFTVALAVLGGLIGLLLIASLGPARQARRMQPAPVLREE